MATDEQPQRAKPLVACQCSRWVSRGRSCKWKATAEDFLCDHCRSGECVLVGIGDELMQSHYRVDIQIVSVSPSRS